jgi:hypothetical protein
LLENSGDAYLIPSLTRRAIGYVSLDYPPPVDRAHCAAPPLDRATKQAKSALSHRMLAAENNAGDAQAPPASLS